MKTTTTLAIFAAILILVALVWPTKPKPGAAVQPRSQCLCSVAYPRPNELSPGICGAGIPFDVACDCEEGSAPSVKITCEGHERVAEDVARETSGRRFVGNVPISDGNTVAPRSSVTFLRSDAQMTVTGAPNIVTGTGPAINQITPVCLTQSGMIGPCPKYDF